MVCDYQASRPSGVASGWAMSRGPELKGASRDREKKGEKDDKENKREGRGPREVCCPRAPNVLATPLYRPIIAQQYP